MIVKIKDICDTISETFDFNQPEIHFLNTGDILEGHIINDLIYKKEELKGQAKKSIKNNDILFSEIRPKNKHYAIVNLKHPEKYVVSTKLMVIRIKSKVNINLKYFYYCITNENFLNKLQRKAENRIGSFPQITFEVLSNFELDLPPRHIQDKIAEILSNIDNQIERNNCMVKRLQDLGNTIFSKIMSEQKNKILLKDIAQMYQPETISSNEFAKDGKYPVYGAGGIIGRFDRYNHENSELMISCRGVCGKAELSIPKSFIIGNQMVIKLNNPKYKYFLYNYFLLYDFSNVETGSVQKQITRANLEKIELELPNEDIINEYFEIFENIYKQKMQIILQTNELNKLKQQLLPLLINGQLEV